MGNLGIFFAGFFGGFGIFLLVVASSGGVLFILK